MSMQCKRCDEKLEYGEFEEGHGYFYCVGCGWEAEV